MRKLFAFTLALMLSSTFVHAQKAFGFGNKILMQHGVVSPFCVYSKGKTYMIICPAKNTNANGSTESYIDEYDNKATKISSKKVKLLNEANKPHTLHKVIKAQDKLFMINSYYEKADKKLSIYGGYLSVEDGEPDGGMGRELVGIETKKPDEFVGVVHSYSPDSTKVAFFIYRLYMLAKEEKIDVHVCVLDALANTTDQTRIIEIPIPKGNNVRLSPTVGNDGSVFVLACFGKMNAQKKVDQVFKMFYKDNADLTVSADMPMSNMKTISHFVAQVMPNNFVLVNGYYSGKSNLDAVDGVFSYFFDPSKGEFPTTEVFDLVNEVMPVIKGSPNKDPKDRTVHTFATSRIFFDNTGGYYLVSYQFKNPADALKYNNLSDKFEYKLPYETHMRNVMISRFDAAGKMEWQKAYTAATMHSGKFIQSVYIMTGNGTDAKFYLIDAEGIVKSSKGSLGDPDNYPNPTLYWPTSETTFVNIGHSPSMAGGFYINTLDMWAAEKKGKVEVEKKKKEVVEKKKLEEKKVEENKEEKKEKVPVPEKKVEKKKTN